MYNVWAKTHLTDINKIIKLSQRCIKELIFNADKNSTGTILPILDVTVTKNKQCFKFPGNFC